MVRALQETLGGETLEVGVAPCAFFHCPGVQWEPEQGLPKASPRKMRKTGARKLGAGNGVRERSGGEGGGT